MIESSLLLCSTYTNVAKVGSSSQFYFYQSELNINLRISTSLTKCIYTSLLLGTVASNLVLLNILYGLLYWCCTGGCVQKKVYGDCGPCAMQTAV